MLRYAPRMRTKIIRSAGILLTFLASVHLHAAVDWSRFRGPNGTGVSDAKHLPLEIGPTTNVVWKTPVPPGHSSPILTATRIYLTAHTPEKDTYKLLVLAIDRKTGAIVWQREVPRVNKGRLENVNGPASPSAVTDGSNVYAFFQEFGLIAFNADGREQWRLPLGPFNIFYGFGASPILVDGTLVLSVDQDNAAYLLAVDRATGKTKWKVDRPHVISGYSTPTVYRPRSGPAQLVIPESFQLTAYSLADGKKLWWVRGLACEMKSVASVDGEYLYVNGWGFAQNQPGQQIPTVSWEEGLKRYDTNQDGKIGADEIKGTEPMDRLLRPAAGFDAFDLDRDKQLTPKEWDVFRAMAAAENGLLSIKLGGSGDMTDSAIRWRYQRPVPQVPSTLLYEGTLFMINDSGILLSFDPETGRLIKQGRLKGAIDKYFASPVGADGKVWLVSQDGTVSIVSAKGEWESLAVAPLDEEVFATPAIDDGLIYIRTKGTLYAFGHPPGAQGDR
jgi:outer membrane protein assembly factor BamB